MDKGSNKVETDKLPSSVNIPSITIENPAAIYSIIRIYPFILYFILNLLVTNKIITICIMTLVALINEVFIKNVCGLHLVGLKWTISFSKEAKGLFQFHSRPPPYIPISSQSNAFWIGFFGSFIVWSVLFFVNIAKKDWASCVACIFIMLLQLFNFILFMAAFNNTKTVIGDDSLVSLISKHEENDSENLIPEPDFSFEEEDPEVPKNE